MVLTTGFSDSPGLSLSEIIPASDIQPLTLTIRPGELVAVPTAPASGTRLARTVVGLARPHAGRVLVDGRDVTTMRPGRRRIGYVPAGNALLPHLTVAENIEYGQRHRTQVQAIAQEWSATLINALELNTILVRRPHQLSPAHQLRVAIARAAASRPAAIVLDRPDFTGGIERLRDLVKRVTPPGSPGFAVLVCSAEKTVLADADRCVDLTATQEIGQH